MAATPSVGNLDELARDAAPKVEQPGVHPVPAVVDGLGDDPVLENPLLGGGGPGPLPEVGRVLLQHGSLGSDIGQHPVRVLHCHQGGLGRIGQNQGPVSPAPAAVPGAEDVVVEATNLRIVPFVDPVPVAERHGDHGGTVRVLVDVAPTGAAEGVGAHVQRKGLAPGFTVVRGALNVGDRMIRRVMD